MDYLVYQGSVHDNDFSNRSQTINHIHLHPSTPDDEYDTWTRQTGSLLQIGAAFSALKPLLDLLILTMEPERIFLVPYATGAKETLQYYTEIIIIVNEHTTAPDALRSLTRVAGCKLQHTHIVLHSREQMETGLADNNFYYTTTCRELFLVFSGSPYRLPSVAAASLQERGKNVREIFQTGIYNAAELVKMAKSCPGQKQDPQLTVMLLRLALELVYRTVNNCFGEKLSAHHTLRELAQKAAVYLPSLFMPAAKQAMNALESACFADPGEENSPENLLMITEKLITDTTQAFESKLSALVQASPDIF